MDTMKLISFIILLVYFSSKLLGGLYGLIIYKGDKTKQIPGQPKKWSFNTTLLIGIIEHLILLTTTILIYL